MRHKEKRLNEHRDTFAVRWQKTLPKLLIGLAGLVVYANSFHGPFVFDDVAAIRDNPTILKLSELGRILYPEKGELDSGVTVEGRPMLNLSFALNYAVGGFEVWGYHAVNLLLHVLAALTLYSIVRQTQMRAEATGRYDSSPWLALVVALLWVVHPLQTASVTYLVQRAESLVGLLYLLTLYCFIRGVDESRWWRAVAVALCALGMTAKEVMVTAPVVVMLYDWVFVTGSFKQTWRERRGFYVALFSTWGVLAVLMLQTGGSNLDILKLMYLSASEREPLAQIVGGTSWWEYMLTQFVSVVHYLRLCVWPSPLIIDYGAEATHGLWTIVPAALMVALLVAATVVGLWRRHWAGYAGAWFFLILAPTTSVVPTNQAAAEHRMYLPLAAVLVLLMAGAYACWRKLWKNSAPSGRQRSLAALAVTLILLGFGLLTLRRNRDYHSELSIWQDTVMKRPANARGHSNLGDALAELGNNQEAIKHYRRALEIKPSYAHAHNNWGTALAHIGKTEEAIEHFQTALEINPVNAKAHYNLGNALASLGKTQEAIGHYQMALEIKPKYAKAHYNLGNELAALGKTQEAIACFQAALSLKPDSAAAHTNLGNAYRKNNRLAEAIACHRKALEFNPNYAEAHNNLGNALLQEGQPESAVEHYEAALRITPDNAVFMYNLANTLAGRGKSDEARDAFERALMQATAQNNQSLKAAIKVRLSALPPKKSP